MSNEPKVRETVRNNVGSGLATVHSGPAGPRPLSYTDPTAWHHADEQLHAGGASGRRAAGLPWAAVPLAALSTALFVSR